MDITAIFNEETEVYAYVGTSPHTLTVFRESIQEGETADDARLRLEAKVANMVVQLSE